MSETQEKEYREMLYWKLHELQKAIRVPKNEVNKFGGFKYRTAEQILEQARAVLPDGVAIVVTDTIIFDDDWRPIAIKATARLLYHDDAYSVDGFALFGTHKGMSPEQATGTASSYARKYALCGLLAIGDGSIDPDAIENEQKAEPKQQPKSEPKQSRADIVKGKALKRLWDAYNEGVDYVAIAKELFYKCKNDEDRNAVMMAQEEFEMQIDAINTSSEHEDAGDIV